MQITYGQGWGQGSGRTYNIGGGGGYQETMNLSPLQSMVENYNRAYGDAKAANEARYQQLLDIANQTTQQRAADINSSYAQQSANTMQSLARLGMSNTTVAPTMKAGIERERGESLNRLADQMQQTKLGIIERRQDAYPDLGALQSLIAAFGTQGGTEGMNMAMQLLASINQGTSGAGKTPAATPTKPADDLAHIW